MKKICKWLPSNCLIRYLWWFFFIAGIKYRSCGSRKSAGFLYFR